MFFLFLVVFLYKVFEVMDVLVGFLSLILIIFVSVCLVCNLPILKLNRHVIVSISVQLLR